MVAKTLILFILPMALSMGLNEGGASNFSADAGAPHLTLSVVGTTVDTVVAPHLTLSVVGTAMDQAVAQLQKVFERSDEAHSKSMEEISKTMSLTQAVKAVQHISRASSVNEIASFIGVARNLRVQNKDAQDGFGGLDGARMLLNDMIHESAAKYDAEIAKCTDYYSSQCALMETARGQISAANFVAANSRALILDAQANINRCETLIPETKQELKDHNDLCRSDHQKMNDRLKVILDDIAIMTMILEMSDCDKKFLQMDKLAMIRCEDKCTAKEFVTFNHNTLQQRMNQLRSPEAKKIIAAAFGDMFDDAESADSMELVQVAGSEYQDLVNKTKPKKTQFNNPPMPKTKVPANPCTDPNNGAPSMANKRAAKCTLKKSPRCYKLQGRFLQIQAAIADDRDQLMEDIANQEASCSETKGHLEASIENDVSDLSSSQTKLAAGTEKEASAGETGRQVAKENEGYHADLLKQMKICSNNYIGFETELCGLKKIRGDVFKKMQKGHSGFFQDCEVSKWVPEACTKKCAGGDQKIIRSVMTHAGPAKGGAGAKCLPLTAMKRCNMHPCPVNCDLKAWTGWSQCSSKCGGGLAQRVRDVRVAMKHGGKPCGAASQTKQCNVAACEKHCVLHEWTRWTSCSKDCDGGSKKRVRMIKEPAEGSGECAGEWSESRLQYRKCNMRRCRVPNPAEALKCNTNLDVVLLLDGTPKSGKDGWAAEQKAANLFVDAFSGPGVTATPNFAVVHYTGPRTWSGVSKCTGQSKKKVDMEKTCRVKIASHFSEDMSKVKNTIDGLQYQPGSKLLSLALMTTQSELALGRKDARTVVVVFVDGEPLSYRKTLLASRKMRKTARLLWVAVTKYSPLKHLKKWASRRWQENLVTVKSASSLAKPEVATHIVANICPRRYPKLKVVRFLKRRQFALE